MKKKLIKKTLIIVILFMVALFPIISSATDFGLGDDFNGYVDRDTSSSLFEKKISILLSTVKYVGVALSVIILIIIGMKYMIGSVEEKADYKKTMMPYIYGTFFLFAGSFVPQLIYDIVKNIGWI